MNDTLFTIGIVLGITAMIILDTCTLLKLKSSKEGEFSDGWLLEKLYFGSAVGMFIMDVFWIISL